MYRVGIVTEQDREHVRVRVRFPDRDQMVSYWLQVVVPKTHADKVFWMPDAGEQVVCLMDEFDEAGAVLGAVYSTADTPPVQSPDKLHLSFKDGSIIEYDRAAHALTITLCDGASATITGPAGIGLQSGASFVSIQPDGIKLQSGASFVSIQPGGVTISPPLPISSTVAQT